MTQLHIDVKAIAGNRPALVFSLEALRGFLVNNFKDSVKRLTNVSVPIDGFAKIEARFTGISVDPAFSRVTLSEVGGIIYAAITPDFRVTIALHVKDDPSNEFSTIDINSSNLKVSLTASAPCLIIGNPDFDVVGTVNLSASRATALTMPGIAEEDVVRIEGAMAFVMPRRVVAAALSTVSSIDLAQHFTAFELRGDWKLQIVNGGLVIIPLGGIVMRKNTGCPVSDSAPDLSTTFGPRTDIGPKDFTWPIATGGVPPSVVKQANDRLDGFVALYTPQTLWDARFSETMPAIVYRESNNGFIGYDLTFTASLQYGGLRIDPARFGIVIDLDFVANGFAFLTVDVPCVGRSDLAYARLSCATSQLSILLSFVLSPAGKLILESQIDSLNIGQVDATVSGFSRWLGLAGGEGTVVGFIIDYVLKRAIQDIFPIKMREAIKQEVNSKNLQLLDLERLVPFTRFQLFNEVTFSADADSVLVGLMSNG